jgi:hypothetical protein
MARRLRRLQPGAFPDCGGVFPASDFAVDVTLIQRLSLGIRNESFTTDTAACVVEGLETPPPILPPLCPLRTSGSSPRLPIKVTRLRLPAMIQSLFFSPRGGFWPMPSASSRVRPRETGRMSGTMERETLD